MVIINLRDYYPEIYTSDEIMEVSEEVARILKRFRQRDRAHDKRVERHPEYSLNCDDGIENKAQRLPLSAEAEYERLDTAEHVRAAISDLPPKMARRVFLSQIIGVPQVEIAKMEGIRKQSVHESIGRSFELLKKGLRKFHKNP